MACELQLLGVAIVIGLINLIWAAAAANRQTGTQWNVGPRDTPFELTGMAGRLKRAFANYRETFPLFAVAVIIAYLGGRTGVLTCYGAFAYVIARALYIPLYAYGVTYVRSLVWGVSLVGILMVLAALVW